MSHLSEGKDLTRMRSSRPAHCVGALCASRELGVYLSCNTGVSAIRHSVNDVTFRREITSRGQEIYYLRRTFLKYANEQTNIYVWMSSWICFRENNTTGDLWIASVLGEYQTSLVAFNLKVLSNIKWETFSGLALELAVLVPSNLYKNI